MRRIFLFCSMLLLLHSVTITAQDWSQPVFGIVEAGARPTEAAQLGVEWERLTFHWNYFQPNSPQDFDTAAISGTALDSARGANRQVVGMIKGTPAWASSSGSPVAVPSGIELPYNDLNNHFAQFVMQLVRFYSERGIHHWIIWNEPDIRPGEGALEFEGEVEQYFLMLKTASLAAQSVDPNVHIQMAGLSWWYDSEHGREPYLLRLLRLIDADPEARQNNWYFDGISVHIYFTTSSVSILLDAHRQILNQFGLQNKEIWLDEYNASPRRDPVTPIGAPFQLSLEQQADFIVQASALALASGVDRLAVYKLFDNDFIPGQSEAWGLVRHDGSLRPAFSAYQQVITTFNGARFVQRYSHSQATLITLEFSNRTTYVLWNETYASGQFLIYTGGEVIVSDAAGQQWTAEIANEQGANVALIDAPAAEQIDMSWVVVGGAVRIITLSGSPRTIVFRSESGVLALN
jgi:polysaccharide biosynthesis protein PslG